MTRKQKLPTKNALIAKLVEALATLPWPTYCVKRREPGPSTSDPIEEYWEMGVQGLAGDTGFTIFGETEEEVRRDWSDALRSILMSYVVAGELPPGVWLELSHRIGTIDVVLDWEQSGLGIKPEAYTAGGPLVVVDRRKRHAA